jgi:hypothetical protein
MRLCGEGKKMTYNTTDRLKFFFFLLVQRDHAATSTYMW